MDRQEDRETKRQSSSVALCLCGYSDLAKEQFREFVNALLIDDLFRRQYRAGGEALTAARRVSESDRVGFGIESDFVRARNVARAKGHGLRRALAVTFAHQFGDDQRRARRRVLLEFVMRLEQERVVLIVAREQRRSFAYDPEEQIHTDREVRAEHERGVVVGGQSFDLVQIGRAA